MSEKPNEYKNAISPWRLRIVYILMAVVVLYYGARLVELQIIDHEDYLAQSNDNRTQVISLPTERGIIYDRNGFVLARNIPTYDIAITPAYLPEDEGARQEIYRQLAELIDVPVNNGEVTDETARLFTPCLTDFGITQIVLIAESNAPYRSVQIQCDVERDVAMIIKEEAQHWPGVEIEINAIREYPTGELTAEIIGFMGPVPQTLQEEYLELGYDLERDKVGYAGVELELEEILAGKNGVRVVEKDGAGLVIRDLEPPIKPEAGNNLVLTIDSRLQNSARTALIKQFDFWNTYFNEVISLNGAVVALNPKTGEVLALVSYPNYENNRMTRVIPAYYYQQLSEDPYRPLFNHAISAEVPPGSVFKLATSIGVLNEGVMTPQQTIECPGEIVLTQKFSPNDPGSEQRYVCWTDAGHGYVDFVHSIALSCDIYYYKVSGGYKEEVPEGLNIWRMAEYAKALGYGEITGIELPGEQPGLIPDPNWKRINIGENWATGDTYLAAMGQGYILSTVLQVAVSFATLANDGKRMRPTLVYEVLDSEGNVIEPFEPELVADITKDPVIEIYDENYFPTGEYKVVEPWVIDLAKEGMRMTVLPGGTADEVFADSFVETAGKTGTAEYCDDIADDLGLCKPGNWPAHAWYAGYAPYDDPEIVVVAFVYNGTEGASMAAPIVKEVIEAYFTLKEADTDVAIPEGSEAQ